MKLDQTDSRSVIAHARAALAMLAALPRGHSRARRDPPLVTLYGHDLSGNLAAFFDYAADRSLPYEVVYATIDTEEYERLRGPHGDRVVLATSVAGMRSVLDSRCIMTSHGPGVLLPLRWLAPHIRFVDVWHGLGFKGNTAAEFRREARQHSYDAICVSSPHYRDIYVERYGFAPDKVCVTGYARVDQLNDPAPSAERVRRDLGLDDSTRVILYAPTWRGEAELGQEIPFSTDPDTFFAELDRVCQEINALFVFRLHRNSKLKVDTGAYSRLIDLPQKEYPDSNALLAATDVLVTDWSSIATDYYALSRPVVWVDTSLPGNVDPSGLSGIPRVGTKASSFDQLQDAIRAHITGHTEPPDMQDAVAACYGETLDGKSAARYDTVLRALIAGAKPPLLPEPAPSRL